MLLLTIVWGAGEDGLLTDGLNVSTHSEHLYRTYELRNTLVPSLDDPANTDSGGERRSPVSGRVEFGSIKESSNVYRSVCDWGNEWGTYSG